MLDKFNNIPLVEASSDGRVVKVPDLETFMQRLKAPPAPLDAAKPTGSPAPAATPTPPPASAPDAPSSAKESPAAGTPSGAGTPGGVDAAAEPGADGAVDPAGSSSTMAVDAMPTASPADGGAPAPEA